MNSEFIVGCMLGFFGGFTFSVLLLITVVKKLIKFSVASKPRDAGDDWND